MMNTGRRGAGFRKAFRPGARRFAAACGLGVVFGAAGCDAPNYPILSPDPSTREIFRAASLTGAAERPTPVTTTASGSFAAELRDFGDTTGVLRFELFVQSIDSVTAAHIHAGTAEVAGPVMVFLFSTATQTPAGTTGILRQGDITRRSVFTAPFTFDSLVTRLRAGTAYANVHTRRNSGGEIRGQITTSPDPFPF